ncbi:hypothetical protein BC567DRAFT_215194 [Phyllosticta citribraziliensis]
MHFQTLQLTTCTDQDSTKTEPASQPTPRRAEPEQETIIIVIRRRWSFISFDPTFEAPLEARRPGLRSSRDGLTLQCPLLLWSGLAGWILRRVSWFGEVRSGPGLLGTLLQHVLISPWSKHHGQFAIAFRKPKNRPPFSTDQRIANQTMIPNFEHNQQLKRHSHSWCLPSTIQRLTQTAAVCS